MPDTEVQTMELIPAPTIKVPVKKAVAKADPAKELKAVKAIKDSLEAELQRMTEENIELRSELEGYRKQLGYLRSYNRAALTNVGDQLTVLQRTINILMAGGEQ